MRLPVRITALVGPFALVLSVLAASLSILVTTSVITAAPASAVAATGGEGAYRGMINWVSWGAAGQQITGTSKTVTDTTVIAGQTLVTTCTISGINPSGGLESYRSGTWQGDGFDNLYNKGGIDGANTMAVGLSNRTNGQTIRFSYTCSATLGGQNFPLRGLVMADAEASGSAEYVGATAPAGAIWRLIDRVRGDSCTKAGTAHLRNNRLEMYGPESNDCEGNDAQKRPGPSAIAFLDGATTATEVTVKGGGKSAIALGVVLQFDFGDAPSSYGVAGAALQYSFDGGTIQSSTGTPPSGGGSDRGKRFFPEGSGANSLPNEVPLATVTLPVDRLGAKVDAELDPAAIQGASADGDDTTGTVDLGGPDDEDAIDPAAELVMTPGQTFTLPQDINFNGTGKVAAWLDLNGNGTFDSGEKSTELTSSGGRLRWNVPNDLLPNGGKRTTYLRLRMVDTPETLSPTGVSVTGEVEDYRVVIATPPRFTLVKKIGTRVDPQDQFTVAATGPGVTAGQVQATTTGTQTSASTTTRLVQAGGAYTITDQMAAGSTNPITDYQRSLSCVDTANGNAPVAVTGTGPWTTANLATGQYVVCTVTNTANDPKVEVSKTFTGLTGPNAAGEYTARYQVVVANSGPQTTSYGPLLDTPDFAPSLEVRGASWTATATGGAAPAAGTATGAGPFTLAPADTTLARRSQHTFTVDVRFRYRNQTPANPCAGPGTGLYNRVGLPAGQETGGTADNSACGTPPDPTRRSLELDKQVATPDPIEDTNGNLRLDAGDTVSYRFVLTNTGQVTLTDVAVHDPLVTGLTCPATTLAPGASTTCTGVHVLTQADMDQGSFTNVATSSGTDPLGSTITSNEDTTSTPLTGAGALVLDKSHAPVHDANGSGRPDAGDTVTYSFKVTNSGTRTVTGVRVTDPMFPGTITCTPSSLAPGASATCETRTLTLTQAHVDAGSVTNTAKADGTSGGTPVESNPDSDVVEIPSRPALVLDKQVAQVTDVDSSGTIGTGDTVEWNFTLTNTGTVTLHDVAVSDPLLGEVTCLADTLAPGATTTCAAAVHTITADETAAGTLTNVATASGTPPTGSPVTSTDETSTPLVPSDPALTILKEAGTPADVNASGMTDAGDTITYTFTVTNTGNVPMRDVTVRDPKLGSLPAACGPKDLAVGASFTCTATYTVTTADEDAKSVDNTATATGVPPAAPGETPDPVTSPPSETSTPVTKPAPALKTVKTAGTPVDVNGSGITDSGDTIQYTFTVTNTGNVPLSGVQVSDPKLGALPAACGPVALAVGESFTCTASYTVSEADETAGKIVNVATSSGVPPTTDGNTPPPVVSPPSTTTTEVTPPGPSLAIEKKAGTPVDANGTGITDAGDTITYTFKVTNTGNVPLTDVTVDDPMLAGGQSPVAVTCPPGPLAPGASRTCTAAPWTITPAQEQDRVVQNSATATGTPPRGTPVTSEPDTTSTPVTPQAPGLSIAKKAGTPVDVNGSGITDAGDTITYTFTVTNTGNVPLTGVTVNDPMLAAAGIQVTCPSGPLAAGDSVTCTAAPYPITEADERAERVRNSATATGTPPRGPVVDSPPSSTTTPVVVPDPRLGIDKQAGVPVDVNNSGLTDAGDTIRYTFTVTNTGNVPLTSISVADPVLADAGITVTCAATTLASGASTTCTTSGPYTVTAADVTEGAVQNSAHAKGTDPDGDPLNSPPDSTSVPTTRPVAALSLVKRAGTPVDTNSSGITDAGDTIRYTFTVTNTGNVPLTSITVRDPKLVDAGIRVTCAATTLAPNASAECTASAPYVVTADDVADGSVRNVATAHGTDPDRGPVTSPEADTSTPTTRPRPGLQLEKDVDRVVDRNGSGLTDAGDTITWTFTVTNTGNVPLTSIKVDDPMLSDAGITLTCPTGPLAPGDSRTCTASGPYTVTETDETAGMVANTATSSGTDPDDGPVTSPPDGTSTPVTEPRPALDVEKVAGAPVDVNNSGITDAGDTIRYAFTVTNTGNVPVRAVGIDDPKLAAAGITMACLPATLPVGAVATCTTSAPYTVTDADEEDKAAENTAAATGTDPDGDPVRSPEDSTSTPTTRPSAGLSVLKEASTWTDVNGSGITDAGDTLGYTFTVTNTGNVPVHDVTVDDPMLSPAPVCAATTLAPGASTTCTTTATHTITEADEQAGSVLNTATAHGTDPDRDPVTSPPDQVTVPVTTPVPGLSLVKETDDTVGVNGWEDLDSSGLVDTGDRITYRFTLTNTGNVPLTGVRVDDPRLPSLPAACGPLDLAVGASATCSGSLLVTAADVASGSVLNTATGVGEDPDGDPVTSPPDTVSVPTTTPQPSLSTAKSAGKPVDVNNSGLTDAGDTITYTFTVTNTGNVPLRDVSVVDPKLGQLPAGCTVALLGVGQDFTCTVDYVVTDADVAAGAVLNTATSTGTPPGTDTPPVVSPPDSTTTPTTLPEPNLTVEKSAGTPTDVNASGITDAGDTIRYSFTVTNTGNVPLRQVGVDDPKLSAQGIDVTCDPVDLAPGEKATCTTVGGLAGDGTYEITDGDVDEGAATNVATGRGTDPDNDPVTSPPDDVSVPVTRPEPQLVLDKQVLEIVDLNGSTITDTGDLVKYGFTVTNTGNVPVSSFRMSDEILTGAAVPITIDCGATPLAPGDSRTCTLGGGISHGNPATPGWYRVTGADVATGEVANQAVVTGRDPDGGDVPSPPDTTSVPVIAPEPKLALDKAVGVLTDAAGQPLQTKVSSDPDVYEPRAPIPGDLVHWTFTVTNAGNVPLASVKVDDPLVGAPFDCGTGPLAPGASRTCVGTSTITQAQIDAGRVDNTATTTGRDPDDVPVTSPPDSASTPLTQEPAIELAKEVSHVEDVNGSGITDAGDRVHWSFQLTNLGNVNLTDVVLTDALLQAQSPPVEVTCQWPGAPGNLPAGTSIPCISAGSSVVTSADQAAGQQTNSASVVGTPPSGDPVTDRDSTSVPVTRPQPLLQMKKTAGSPVDVNKSGITDAGDTIAYTFEVTNVGNVPITGLVVNDPKLDGQSIAVACDATRLAPGESTSCHSVGSYTVTAADVRNGSAGNTATASGNPPGTGTNPPTGPVTSPPSSTTTPTTTPQPGLSLVKRVVEVTDVNGSGLQDAGDTIVYSFEVTNTGNVPLKDVTVVDPKLGVIGGDCATVPVLAVGAAPVTCTSRVYTITAADVAAGAATNTATATGTDPDGGTVDSPPSSTTVPTTTPQPALVIEKAVAGVSDTNASGITDAGDRIAWTFTVTNAGNVPLHDVAVWDAQLALGTPVCTLGTLAPGATAECGPFTRTVTEADEASGAVENSATARGTDPDGGRVDSPPDTTATPVTTPEPKLSVTKEAGTPLDVNGSGITDAGDTIVYTFTVTNAGNVPISDVRVTDPKLVAAGVPVTCQATSLAPGESTTCTSGAYRVTADDVEAGSVDNLATAEGTDPDKTPVTSPPDSTSTPTTRPAPSLTVDKQAGTPVDVNNSGITDAGDTIVYTFTVTNTGNVPITDVDVQDRKLTDAGVSITCPAGVLAPGAVVVCTSDPYRVTVADVSAGSVANTARATGTDPDRVPVTSPPDSTSVPVTAPRPASTLVKSVVRVEDVNDSGITDAPDEIWYAFTVTNTGNVPLSDLRIDDPLLGSTTITCDPASLDADGRLGVGEDVVCTAEAPYVVTGDDERNDAVRNTATAHSTDPDRRPVVSEPDDESVPTTTPYAGLSLVKEAGEPVDVNNSGITDAGDTIAYTFTVTNTGNVPVRQVRMDDDLLTRAGVTVTCPAGPLAVGAEVTCVADAPYVVTEADELAGHVANTAAAGGVDPDGDPVTSPPDSTSTPVTLPQPGLLVTKEGLLSDSNGSGNPDRGDTIDFTFTVTNTGNVPIDRVRVEDPMLTSAGVDVTCPSGRLEPGEVRTCTATGYSVTAADATAGQVHNVAIAHGEDPDGDPVDSPPGSTTVPLVEPDPELTLVKHAGAPVDVDADGRVSPGDTVEYTFTVTNSGNVTLDDIAVSDPMLTGAGLTLTCPATRLAAGEPMTCAVSGPWVISQAQVDAGEVVNTASVTGRDPWEDPVTPDEDTARVPVPRAASIALDKQAGEPVDANGSGRLDAGDTIAYTFVVTNTGTSTLTDLAIDDPLLTAAGEEISCPVTSLGAGASTSCTALHTITGAELDAGSVSNTAHATGRPPAGGPVDGEPVRSDPDSTSTPLRGVGGLSLVKKAQLQDADNDDRADAGERIRYSFTVTNTGTLSVREVAVEDPMLAAAGVSVTCPVRRLAPGESVTCTATYRVRASDVDAAQGQGQEIRNVAHATGRTPRGDLLASARDTAVVRVDSPDDTPVTPDPEPSDPDKGVIPFLPDAGGPGMLWVLLGGSLLGAGAFTLLRQRRRSKEQPGR